MEAQTVRIGSEIAGQSGATAAAVGTGAAIGLLLSGAPPGSVLAPAAAVFGLAFAAALTRGRAVRRDPGLRLLCDAISAAGAVVLFWVAPGLTQI